MRPARPRSRTLPPPITSSRSTTCWPRSPPFRDFRPADWPPWSAEAKRAGERPCRAAGPGQGKCRLHGLCLAAHPMLFRLMFNARDRPVRDAEALAAAAKAAREDEEDRLCRDRGRAAAVAITEGGDGCGCPILRGQRCTGSSRCCWSARSVRASRPGRSRPRAAWQCWPTWLETVMRAGRGVPD